MGAIQKPGDFTLPDNLTQDFLIPFCFNQTNIAVSVMDAMYLKGTVTPANGMAGDVAYPADQLATAGTEAIDQISFASLFLGYSQDQILYLENNLFKRFTIRTEGVITRPCPSQTWKHGDLVGIYSNGVTIDPQSVDKVTLPGAAIGICIKESAVLATRVTFRFESRWAGNLLDSAQFGSLFDSQPVNQANVLSDANQVFAVNSPFFSTQSNTGARTITLSLESASKKLAFMVANLAASIGSITFKGSAGGNILANAVLPAGKTCFVFCDGANWYGFISA
jgi:hypothetical protein